MARTITDAEVKEARSREAVVAGEPGYGLGLAGFIVSFFVSLAGLIMSAIALKQSKRIGKKNPFALAGLIIGIVFTVFGLIATVISALGVIFLINYCDMHPNSSECSDMSSNSGSHYDRGYREQDQPDQTY